MPAERVSLFDDLVHLLLLHILVEEESGVRIRRTHSSIEPMNPPRRSIPLSSTRLWRRGLGRGGSFFDRRFMRRRSVRRVPLSLTLSPLCGARGRHPTVSLCDNLVYLPLLRTLAEERAGVRRFVHRVPRSLSLSPLGGAKGCHSTISKEF